MKLPNSNYQGWIANLSNGFNVYEGNPEPGQKTPWQLFIDYILSGPTFSKPENGVQVEKPIIITRMQLVWNGRVVNTLPNKQCQGYYVASEVRKSVFTGSELHSRGIGSVVGDLVFITWVDDNGEVTQDVRTLADSRPHTTLREADANPTHNKPGP